MDETIELSCSEVWLEISNYVDDEVDADLQASMRAHFRVCAHCTAVLDGTRNVVNLFGDGTLFKMPEGFQQRLLEKLKGSPS